MLNPFIKLNPHIFEPLVERRAIRDGFGEGLLAVGKQNPNVVALSADVTESTRVQAFAEQFPKRFFEIGVAEQNMAGIAAGLAVSGKIPFISSYAVFSPGRNWEQIRTTICYNNANVKIAGHHAGLFTGPDGATHQALEDIALMRTMPNMKVIVPCDTIEARKATIASVGLWGPVYLRFSRDPSPVITTNATPFTPGKAELLLVPGQKGRTSKPDVVIYACGVMVARALQAARILEKEKIKVSVLNVHTIKPLDAETILNHAGHAGTVVTAEDHQIAGGLGGAIAELLARKLPAPIEFVGMRDAFGQSGTPDELAEFYGMDAAAIVAAVKRAIKRK